MRAANSTGSPRRCGSRVPPSSRSFIWLVWKQASALTTNCRTRRSPSVGGNPGITTGATVATSRWWKRSPNPSTRWPSGCRSGLAESGSSMSRAALGITANLPTGPSVALGTGELTLLELTQAYAVFANAGHGVWAHGIREIRDRAGSVLYRRSGSGPGRVVEPALVGTMNAMLSAVIDRGTGKAAAVGRPAAGKTGTSQDHRGRLVHRVHGRLDRRHMGRERRWPPDARRHGRRVACTSVARVYARCPGRATVPPFAGVDGSRPHGPTAFGERAVG